MKVAIVGPISVRLLKIPGSDRFPLTHSFAMNSDLVNALIDRGHDVHVFTAGSVRETVRVNADPHSITIVPRRHRASAAVLYIPTMKAMIKALKEGGPYDVVHAHWLYDYALAALAVTPNALVTIHDWPARIVRLSLSLPTFSRYLLSKYVVPRVRYATAPSPYMEEGAIHSLKIKGTTLIPNGVPDASFASAPAPDDKNHQILAINIGFDRRKNVAVLLHAFARVRARIPEACLTLVGSDYGRGERAELYAKAHGIEMGVVFLGRIEREVIDLLLSKTALFVHPSLEESFGLVVIEAMARGVAVLGGERSGAVPWLLDQGRAGYLVDVTSADKLADAMIRALSDRALTHAIARKGWLRAREHFTVSGMADRFEMLYEKIRGSP